MGTLAKIKQMLKLPNGTMRVLVEGLNRIEVKEIIEEEDCFLADVMKYNEEHETDVEDKALMRTLLDYFEQYI
ncbi:LON peptidase substrate-binding domain-containing protein, partial [Escherichia coli]|nr:LON peptidase substrate-binding domain-containing protein [Escherichia coli]